MWVILPAVSLAIAHIAGDNLAVVPDMAAQLGTSIYLTTFVAYIVFGVIIAGVSAWIGVKTGQELIIVVRRIFGCTGKRLMALTIIAICLPASALTGGYFSGWIVSAFSGIPHCYASFVCIAVFSILTAERERDILRISNYFSLLLLPALTILFVSIPPPENLEPMKTLNILEINWLVVLALVGYNAGGMRPALVVETAAYLSRRKNQAIVLAVIAKIVEGIITLLLAHMALMTGAKGPMAVTAIAESVFGKHGILLFNLLLLSTFMNTMVPAMNVNARQLVSLMGLSYRMALLMAAVVVYLISCFNFEIILLIMSGTGALMATFIILTAFYVHKLTGKQS